MRYVDADAMRMALEQRLRYSVISELAGRRFEQFPLDVGLVESPALAPDVIDTEGSLGFADITLPPLTVIAIEQHIAEKVHAYTATYGTDGRGSTRVKDLVDLVLIARHASPRAERLQQALQSTFARYGTQLLPDTLPPPPAEWIAPYARLARDVGLPSDLVSAHSEARALIDPVLRGQTDGAWDMIGASWCA